MGLADQTIKFALISFGVFVAGYLGQKLYLIYLKVRIFFLQRSILRRRQIREILVMENLALSKILADLKAGGENSGNCDNASDDLTERKNEIHDLAPSKQVVDSSLRNFEFRGERLSIAKPQAVCKDANLGGMK